jgi:hypothetical protein
MDWREVDPVSVLKAVESRLKENEKLISIIQIKNRCIRLNYAGDFHLDVVPACPLNGNRDGFIKIPDRDLRDWRDSNSKGYANWFEERSKTFEVFMAKAAFADMESLPEHEEVNEKPPLKKTVQLMKRHRDIYFQHYPQSAPVSILLTTLAGQEYQGEPSTRLALSTVLDGISRRLEEGKGRISVFNPVNPSEDLSEKWRNDPQLYNKFLTWFNEFSRRWKSLNNTIGLPGIAAILRELFGEEVTDYAIDEQAEFVEKNRKNSTLKVASSGLIISKRDSGNIVKPNTFYGSKK